MRNDHNLYFYIIIITTGAVIHSHGVSCNLVSVLFEGQAEYRIRNQEMIKGIVGHGYRDELVIPIIDNTPVEYELTASLDAAVLKYPRSVAVLVRHHGIYVWGNSWEEAKRHAECLHYLFELSLKICHLSRVPQSIHEPSTQSIDTMMDKKRMRLSNDQNNVTHLISNPVPYKYVLLDIEGTTTPITFVKDIMFPYAAANVEQYLKASWGTIVTISDVTALHNQYLHDLKSGEFASQGMPCWNHFVIDGLVDEATVKETVLYVHWCIEGDRKIKSLKDLQGRIWRSGFESGAMKSEIYADVPVFLDRMMEQGVKVCVYSSGSREAQKLLFGYSVYGNLRPYFTCYFDTSVGNKRVTESYREITLSLNVDDASEILFVTDVFEEASAAASAGMHVVISVRPGTAPLPDSQPFPFKRVTSFDEI